MEKPSLKLIAKVAESLFGLWFTVPETYVYAPEKLMIGRRCFLLLGLDLFAGIEGYNLLKNGVYWGYNPLILTFY